MHKQNLSAMTSGRRSEHGQPDMPPGPRSRAATRLSLHRSEIGPLTVGVLMAGYAVLWLLLKPPDEPMGRFVGQLFGAETVLLASVAIVLISTLPWIETWFNGIDRAAIWHRRIAITALVFLLPHAAFTTNPDTTAVGAMLAAIGAAGLFVLIVWAVLPRWRTMLPAILDRPILAIRGTAPGQWIRRIADDYELWRTLHRSTGVFVAAGFVHGLLDATAFGPEPVLRWSFVAIGGLGLAFYLYRELLARHLSPFYDYQVETVRAAGEDMVEISLAPLGPPLEFMAGQFVFLNLEAKDGWQRHPFTISSAPEERLLRFTIKALGDYTSQLQTAILPGMPAVIGRPHGRFNWRSGTHHQLWIAAGVGVTPFLSWLRSLDKDFHHDVDFFYTARGEAPFADEILAIASRHPSLRVHIIDTSVESYLTPERMLGETRMPIGELSVYMCGPEGMMRQFQNAFMRADIAGARIPYENFNVR